MKGKIEQWFDDQGLVPTKPQREYIQRLDATSPDFAGGTWRGGRLSGKSWLMGHLVAYFQQELRCIVRTFSRRKWDEGTGVPHVSIMNGEPVPAPQRRMDLRASDTIMDIYTAWEWDEREVWAMWVGFEWR